MLGGRHRPTTSVSFWDGAIRAPYGIVRVATAALEWKCSGDPQILGGTHWWASNNAPA